jgi:Fe-S-cluster containining protein
MSKTAYGGYDWEEHSEPLAGRKARGVQTEAFIVCFRCGVCCNGYQVNLSLSEGRRIADALGLTWEEFLDRYADQRWPGVGNVLLHQRNGACVFLEQTEGSKVTRCVIHPVRPSACAEWVPTLYRKECQQGLIRYWGLKVKPSGQLEGARQRVREFHALLESLAT